MAADGGYIISGNSKSLDADLTENHGENDIWVIKTDNKGSLVWEKTLGGPGLDFGFDALEAKDGSILFMGESKYHGFP